MKGSLEEELLLWCFFLLPGLLYSIWRRGDAYYACANCGASTVIPVDSPTAKKLCSKGHVQPLQPEHDSYGDTGEDPSRVPGIINGDDRHIALRGRARAKP